MFVWGHAVAQLVEALRYKPEGRVFDSRWSHWDISLIKSFQPHYGPRVDSASNRNKYQGIDICWRVKDGRCLGLITLPPLICRLPRNSGSPNGLYRPLMG